MSTYNRNSRFVKINSQHLDTSNYWRSASFNPQHVKNSLSDQRRPFRLLRCIFSFYNAKIITVEPVIFLFMFAYYFYNVIFQLFAFNHYGQTKIKLNTNITTVNTCLTVKEINHLIPDGLKLNGTMPGDIVEHQTAYLLLIVEVAARLPSAVTTLILGPISDRFGRKPTLMVNLFGMLLNAVVVVVIIEKNLKHDSNLYYFALGAGLRGLCGGIASILTACYAYIADVSSRRWLVVRLGLLEAMTFAASTLSLVTAGVWSQFNNCDFKPMVWVILGCMMVAIPYTLFLLPESLERDEIKEREENKPKALIGPKAVLRGLQIFFGRDYPRCKLWLLLLVMVVTIVNTTGSLAIITLFLLDEPISWTPIHIGGYMATSELMRGLGLILILPFLVYLGIKDSLIVGAGLLVSIGANVSLGFADQTWQIYTIGVVQCLDALILPGVKAIMSKTVQPVDHGALFSFISVSQVLASVLGYAVFIPVYSATLKVKWIHSDGISFFIMATLYGLMLPVLLVVWYLQRREKNTPMTQTLSFDPHPERGTVTHTSPEEERLLTQVRSELGQDTLERRSCIGSLALSTDLENSLEYSGSFRAYR